MKLVWNFTQKIPPWEIWHITVLFKIKIFSILCLIFGEISMKFHSKNTSLRNMTHNTSIQNQHLSILCLFLAEIRMKFHIKDNALKNMTQTTLIPNQNFRNLC